MLDLLTSTILPVKGLHPAIDGQDTMYLLTILDPDFRCRVIEVSVRVYTEKQLSYSHRRVLQ
jgi:hypothetical protein